MDGFHVLTAASHDPKAQARLRGIDYLPATAWLAAHAGHLARPRHATLLAVSHIVLAIVTIL
jgi:hypothetical protein